MRANAYQTAMRERVLRSPAGLQTDFGDPIRLPSLSPLVSTSLSHDLLQIECVSGSAGRGVQRHRCRDGRLRSPQAWRWRQGAERIMGTRDSVGNANEAFWESEAAKGDDHCIAWLDLEREDILRYVSGELDRLPDELAKMYPPFVLDGVAGRDVLCLASGGGQQSAVFGLLGAQVTVVDVARGQLVQDAVAAQHYGYEIELVQADMRDLSELSGRAFDLVFQAPSMSYVPDVREVYVQVDRVLKPGGMFRLEATNPATQFIDEEWRGGGYRITKPFSVTTHRRDTGAIDHRHYLKDFFNGLIELGYRIEHVEEAPIHLADPSGEEPGSWAHILAHIPWLFAIVARKPG